MSVNEPPNERAALLCAVCQRPVAIAPRDEHFPFCSNRCRTIDLGRWLDQRYMVDMKTGKLDFVDDNAEVEEVDPETDGEFH